MMGMVNGIRTDYNCGYDYVFVIGGDGIIKWRGAPSSPALVPALDSAIEELSTSATEDSPKVRHQLLAGYPNPFNPMTTIPFELAEGQAEVGVKLEILDVRGRVVRTLVDGYRAGGQRHSVTWDGLDQSGRQVPSGTYMSRLKVVGTEPQAKLLTLVK
jgi:FlgD Ig-like domain